LQQDGGLEIVADRWGDDEDRENRKKKKRDSVAGM
jgi:hypothetical protein